MTTSHLELLIADKKSLNKLKYHIESLRIFCLCKRINWKDFANNIPKNFRNFCNPGLRGSRVFLCLNISRSQLLTMPTLTCESVCHNPNSTTTQLKVGVDFTPPTQTQCPQFLSCSGLNFNQTLKIGLWDQQQQ